MSLPTLILTCGEPAGIGPDLALMQARKPLSNARLVVAGNKALLAARAAQLGIDISLRDFSDTAAPAAAGELLVLDHGLAAEAVPGQLNPANAGHVLSLLDTAIDGCLSGRFAAMITAPLHKGVINDAGIPFTGHTEYLADKTAAQPVMMLAAGSFRVALATTHLPLKDVPAAITTERLERVLRVLHHDLITKFAIPDPHILVSGLNPHAGESGHMGREECDIIDPLLERLRSEGFRLSGALPADTLFTPRHLDTADAVLAMFHDQGLPVLKYAGFGQAVNVTLGLPLTRTSVDHGTALDLAGSGQIDAGSLNAAIAMAARMGGVAPAH
ncbi:4-hydroxythreonine-4-phosphate dehydrogenase PdxA [Granulosicoccaceae sp. 1_MG-2023]|nr:4-hydroxythreonine-4-phosphate dehydrogenase PdxA [Granulosicoccaceae sp. 1_MG-2023]